MARSTPDSASSGWFICINDQPSLDFDGKRNPDGQGFAAFGRVIKGMDVVRRIQQAPSSADRSSNAAAQRLTPPIKIVKVSRLEPQ
jgi:peptidyl-prolyl cis-trans isomerase A (cyclophilin A)